MRKYEVVVAYEQLPEIARIIHEKELVFEVCGHKQDTVTVALRYSKEQEQEVSELEQEIDTWLEENED